MDRKNRTEQDRKGKTRQNRIEQDRTGRGRTDVMTGI